VSKYEKSNGKIDLDLGGYIFKVFFKYVVKSDVFRVKSRISFLLPELMSRRQMPRILMFVITAVVTRQLTSINFQKWPNKSKKWPHLRLKLAQHSTNNWQIF
jgi:hypothetical protein